MLVYFIFVSIPLIFGYLAILSLFVYHWEKTNEWHLPSAYKPTIQISVLIAARNESKNIAACIDSLKALNYPSEYYEVLIVDDHSEDNTAAIVESKSNKTIRLLRLPQHQKGKKKALAYAVEAAKGTLIVCTDADCLVPSDWLMYFASFYQFNQFKFIAAPVTFYSEKNKFQQFQSLDFMGMMAVAAAGIRGGFMQMSNGANLAFEKKAFETVKGYEGHEHLASGDDMLLMEKIAKRYPKQLGFLKQLQAQTKTKPPQGVSAFVDQRIRWASKSSSYSSWQVKFILLMVWLLCLSILMDAVLVFWNSSFLYLVIFKLVLKALADFYFLNTMAVFFKRKSLMKAFVPSFFFHCTYIILIGFLGNLRKEYRWKGRKTR